MEQPCWYLGCVLVFETNSEHQTSNLSENKIFILISKKQCDLTMGFKGVAISNFSPSILN